MSYIVNHFIIYNRARLMRVYFCHFQGGIFFSLIFPQPQRALCDEWRLVNFWLMSRGHGSLFYIIALFLHRFFFECKYVRSRSSMYSAPCACTPPDDAFESVVIVLTTCVRSSQFFFIAKHNFPFPIRCQFNFLFGFLLARSLYGCLSISVASSSCLSHSFSHSLLLQRVVIVSSTTRRIFLHIIWREMAFSLIYFETRYEVKSFGVRGAHQSVQSL